MNKIYNKEELQKNMFAAYNEQKILVKKRDTLLKNKSNNDALQITHKIAKLEDFIRMAENNLKMID